jgi:hypothetical protein
VPEPLRAGIKALIQLDDEGANGLLEALSQCSPSLKRDGLLQQLRERLGSRFEPAQLELLVDGLFTLASGAASGDQSAAEFAAAIASAPELGVSADLRNATERRILGFLTCEPLVVTSKAIDVINEQPARFIAARILTDMRPIFGTDVNLPPVGAVVGHTLRIAYVTARRREEFFVALDADDLDELEEAVKRARQKAFTTAGFLRGADIRDLSPRGKEGTSG